MEKVEIHLVHGFLGLPTDWNDVEEALTPMLAEKGIEGIFVKENLWEDYTKIVETAPHGGKNYLQVWGERKQRELMKSRYPKIMIGYSLGGRLLMHFPIQNEDRVLAMIYISSHPGIDDSFNRQQRKMSDSLWGDKFEEMSWAEVVDEWNSQPAFANDNKRPSRNRNDFDKSLVVRYFKDWSLGTQLPADDRLRNLMIPQYWLYGEDDKAFKELLPRMEGMFGLANCIPVVASGHGCIFENPKDVAQKIAPIVAKR